MIQKISIENYKSIKTLSDFELKPVNILIGANNSGKSNFLDVFAFLRDTLSDLKQNGQIDQNHKGWKGALHRRGGIASICFQRERQLGLSCWTDALHYQLAFGAHPWIDSNAVLIKEELAATSNDHLYIALMDNHIVLPDESSRIPIDEHTGLYHLMRAFRSDAQARDFAQKLSEIKIYDRLHTEIQSPVRIPKIANGETILDEDGGNLVGVLYQLAQTQPQFLEQLNSLLKIVFDDFAGISFPSNDKGELLIRWADANGSVSNVTQLSDGTLKLLCLVAILKNSNPPAFVGIDEVDTNLHPKMQTILADLIQEASQKTQIVATTHNPDFVSLFDPGEIVILQRYKGATETRRFSTKGALGSWLKDFTTRELWLMGELESRW